MHAASAARLARNFSKAWRFEVLRNRLCRISSFKLAINSTNIAYAFVFILYERIFLADPLELDALAQSVHGKEVLLPQPVYGVEDDVALQGP